MGTSGLAVTSDDTVADVVGTVVERLKAGDTLQAASNFALREFKSYLNDADDGPLVWLGLAHVQWKYGQVESQILDQVKSDVATERGLDRWRDDPGSLRRRKIVLEKFVEKISTANPKPSSPPRTVVRLAPFAQGDCLAVLTRRGDYTAAIVLATDNSRQEYGSSLIGSLDYLSSTPPVRDDFERRKWLFKHHGNWHGEQELHWYGARGLRKEKGRISVVERTVIRDADPCQSKSCSGLNLLGEQILLCHAPRGEV